MYFYVAIGFCNHGTTRVVAFIIFNLPGWDNIIQIVESLGEEQTLILIQCDTGILLEC